MKKKIQSVLMFCLCAVLVVSNSVRVYAGTGDIDSSVYHTSAPDTSIYQKKVGTGYFVAGSLDDAKAYVDGLGTFDGCDYIYIESRTDTCYHYYENHVDALDEYFYEDQTIWIDGYWFHDGVGQSVYLPYVGDTSVWDGGGGWK